LHRRDFSINTLALRLDGRYYGELLDHWGGGKDLQEGLIRVLHSLSFVDDPTRMLRAVRLEQRLEFTLEPRTLELLQEALPLLDRVSGDRIRNELDAIFQEQHLFKIMRRLDELGLLSAINHALTWSETIEKAWSKVASFSPPESWRLDSLPSQKFFYYGLWFFELEASDVRKICERLHFPSIMRQNYLDSNRLGKELPSLCSQSKPSSIVEELESLREPALLVVWLGVHDQPECQKAVENYLSHWRFVSPQTSGETLREMGLSPGPMYSQILKELRDAWLDGKITSPEEENEILLKWVQ
jgi:tRNA nucleotidyltransferase (CCA-adding enzyme)